MRFEKVGMEKLEDLVKTRIQVLRAANKLDGSADMGQTEQESRTYYEKSLEDGSHVAYLVYDGDLIIGTGGISFYQVMPTYHNPTGMKAYIMNMYTDPGSTVYNSAYLIFSLSYLSLFLMLHFISRSLS